MFFVVGRGKNPSPPSLSNKACLLAWNDSPFYDELSSLQLSSAWLTCLDSQRDELLSIRERERKLYQRIDSSETFHHP